MKKRLHSYTVNFITKQHCNSSKGRESGRSRQCSILSLSLPLFLSLAPRPLALLLPLSTKVPFVMVMVSLFARPRFIHVHI